MGGTLPALSSGNMLDLENFSYEAIASSLHGELKGYVLYGNRQTRKSFCWKYRVTPIIIYYYGGP